MVTPARVYHRAYKSVDEDQIGFQKYKIHGDIKKQKEARPRGGDAEGGCRRRERERAGRGDWWPRFGPPIQLVYANFGLIYTRG